MQIEIINDRAEQILLDRVKHSASSWGALHICASRQERKPGEEAVVLTVRTILEGRKASVYFFQDGDLVVTWAGAQKAIVEALRTQLCRLLHMTPDPILDRYYDSLAQGEELSFLCTQKLGPITAEAIPVPPTPAPVATIPLKYDDMQAELFQNLRELRPRRKRLEMLIVEDQVFSAKLLAGLLDRIGHAEIAHHAQRGLELYLQQAPDITFLDIELPGNNGHELAATLRQLDPDAYIVMVTANHDAEDVRQAKSNGAKGFVVKPYSKQKILANVEKYIHDRKLNS